MKTNSFGEKKRDAGWSVVYLFLAILVVWSVAMLAVYVTQTSKMTARRSDLATAINYADAGVVIACADLATAYTNFAHSLATNLLTATNAGYVLNSSLSTNNMLVYQRTITTPFTNQTVAAQIRFTNSPSPQNAQVSATVTVNQITQTAIANVEMKFGYGAAIVSVNAGTITTSDSKPEGQAGNVSINGVGTGSYLIVDGGMGQAVQANGSVNVAAGASVPGSAISATNWGTANQIPDYTTQGTANELFDFNRFIALATAGGGRIYSNFTTFISACSSGTVLEGMTVVDVDKSDKDIGNLTPANLPNGINIRGTLFFNFVGTGWTPTSSFVITAALNINAANLTGLVPGNSSTYATGYPPTYTDPTKNPVNVNITPYGYANFQPGDDLPAYMYSIGEPDMHGPLNICGTVYTPSYMEIENKSNGQTQYIRGVVIVGNGLYLENTSTSSTSIVSYDANAINNLATSNNVGKSLFVTYWQ